MELKYFTRKSILKGETNKLRRSSKIPAIMYSAGEKSENIFIDLPEFSKVLAKLPKGKLSTTVFTLLGDDKKKTKAIVKEIQYERTSYKILHLDFLILKDKNFVNLKVPLHSIGMEICDGIKQGGTLRQVIRKVKVKCLPKDIPSEFVLDISDLSIKESKRLKDIKLPNGVFLKSPENEVAVVIAKGT